jgi:hypothetical protein
MSIFYLISSIIISDHIARKQVNESLPEVPVEDPVYDGVQHGVGIAQP